MIGAFYDIMLNQGYAPPPVTELSLSKNENPPQNYFSTSFSKKKVPTK
jgi:hypothetical protein